MTCFLIVIARFTEGSPGKAEPADSILSVIFNPKNTTLPGDSSAEPQNDTCIFVCAPIFGYALPLKRERWHAKPAGEGATLPKVATLRSR